MNLIDKFNGLDPTKKRQFIIGGILFGVIFISAIFSATMERKKKQDPRADKPDVTVIKPERVTGIEHFTAELEAVNRQIKEIQTVNKAIQSENASLKESMKGAGGDSSLPGPDDILGDASGTAKLPVLSAPTALPPPLPVPPPPPPVMQAGGNQETKPVDPPVIENQRPLQFRMIGEQGAVTESDISKSSATKEPSAEAAHDVYIPSGSMFSAVLLNGMDAPTSSAAQKNPTPVVMRVKREAVLPNYAAIDVRECFLIAAGYGHLSSERAMLRAETLSCVRTDGQVFESKLDAYIVGSDGKVGVPGRLVSKQGQMIAQSLIAGIFSGLGNAMNKSKVPALNLNPMTGTTLYQSDSIESIAQSGVSGGISSTANALASFYLDMAKESFPVVEINAGSVGTVIVTRGANLPLKGTASLKQYIDPNAKNQSSPTSSLTTTGKAPVSMTTPKAPEIIQPIIDKVTTQTRNITGNKPSFSNGKGW